MLAVVMPQFILFGLVFWSHLLSAVAASRWDDFESNLWRRGISPPGPNEYKCSGNLPINPEKLHSCVPNPCKNGGVCMNEGATFSCKCPVEYGGVACEERKAECQTFGDPHYYTFNKQRFDFMGKGRFVLAEDCVDHTFKLRMLNDYCGTRHDATCLVELLIQFKNNIIRFYRGKPEIALNQKKYILTRPMCGNGFVLRRVSSERIILSTDFGMEIEWNGDRTIRVFLLSKYKGKTCGLCGKYGVDDNDCGAKGKCNENTAVSEFCRPGRGVLVMKCERMLKPPFQACNSYVDPSAYVRNCKFDVCRCDDPWECLCSAFASYSKDCADYGKILNWRNGGRAYRPLAKCAKRCNPTNVFTECGSSCVRTCSDLSKTAPCDEECVAECRCPEGKLLDPQGNCVSRELCPCEIGGLTYQSKQTLKKGECESCTCHAGVAECRNTCTAGPKPEPCDSSPCKNGGECSSLGDSFLCQCTGDFQGDTCEKPNPKPCESSPCKNGGACTNEGNDFKCRCKKGYKGETCEVAAVSCVKGDWTTTFASVGWSTCPKEYPFISGLERTTSSHFIRDYISHIVGAQCCAMAAESYECMVVNLIGTIRRRNSWNMCPVGFILSGLYRNRQPFLTSITQAKCCKPTDRPAIYENCYDEDVTDDFNNNDQGMRTCKRPGHFITGFFKSSCNFLYCIEKFRCCSPTEIKVNNPCSPNPCKNGGKCFTLGNRFSCRCSPKFGGATCEEEKAVCEAQGDPHYTTFDRRRFNFMGKCEYVFARDCSSEKAFTVLTKNVACGRRGASCVSVVKAQFNGNEILFTRAAGVVRINGVLVRAFPVVKEGFIITLPDRKLVLLTTTFGLEVSWNFMTLVRVAVSGRYKRKTCGLCGNYDGNANNDRPNPTDLKCVPNPSTLRCKPSRHIRAAYVKCESMADSRSPFSACHATVDPKPFIDDCIYDLCRCARPWLCVCASVADYVQECAKNGIVITWRAVGSNVYRPLSPCRKRCPRGQIFTECGSSCARTCNDLSNTLQCNEECVSACRCPEGQVLNNRARCVPISLCPCSHEGKTFTPGQSVRVRKCRNCICYNGGMNCVEEEGCVTEPCDFSPCKNGGDCTNKGSSFSCKCSPRFIGATCEKVNSPCSPNPCKNGGKCFTLGSRFSCRCSPKFGGATCEEERAVCEAQGDPHYTTFDRRRFNFMGKCEYVFARDCSGEKAFTVLTKNVACGRRGASCVSVVKAQFNGNEILFTRAAGVVRINGVLVRAFPVVKEGFIITLPDRNLVLLTTKFGLEVSWNFLTLVRVAVSGRYKRKTCGLCGNYDGNANNDRPNPTDLKCVPNPSTLRCKPSRHIRAAYVKCESMADSRSPFSACHATVDPKPFIDDCIYDLCRCARPWLCVCASVADYVQECAKNGIVITWRAVGSNVYRPLSPCRKRCPRGQIFTECGSSCARTCSDLSGTLQCNEECVSACRCPEGQVLNSRGRCVPISLCPCSHEGKTFTPGQSVRVRKCRNCICYNGGMTCVEEEDCVTEPCDFSPCKNGGDCTNKGSSFSCKCSPGFIGATCEKEVPNPCKRNPCKNGGECEVLGNRFSCRCKPQFGGSTCEHGQSMCEAHGDPHYTTFDKKKFNFMGRCDYIFAEDCSVDKAFRVETKNVACGGRVSCTAAVTVRFGGNVIKLSRATRTAIVNGAKITKFPFKKHGFVVTNPTLSWLLLTTNIGLKVSWNCKTIVRVTVSGKYKRKTCGLCGNNDGIQGNDLLPPNMPCAPPPGKDQCQPTLQTLPFIRTCNLMASRFSPFNRCRSFVNPADLIRDCRYDACRCDDPMQCVCAAFAAYSKRCSDNGKVLAWRFRGTYLYKPLLQCEKKCGNVGEMFTECGSSCAQTCRDLSRDIQCNEQCVPGCQCPSGQVVNDEGRCIPKAKCPCYFHGGFVQPGENMEVGNCKTCTCTGGAMACVDDRDCASEGPCDSLPCKNDGICLSEGDSFLCTCTGDYQGLTCEEQKPQPCDSSPCKNGGVCSNDGESFSCECQGGYKGETCEESKPKPAPCESSPCKNGGECTNKESSFNCKCPPNFIGGTCEKEVPNPCKPNPCKNGGKCEILGNRFSCRCKPQFGGDTCEHGQSICEAHGDPHYTTFDKKKFNFMGRCDYIFAEDCSVDKAFRVETKNVACGGRVSCTAAVTVRFGGNVIKLTRALRTAIVNGVKITKFPFKRPGFVITNPTLSWLLLTTNIGLKVSWNCRTIVRVSVSGEYKRKTCGLCGNNDGIPGNDILPTNMPCAPPPGKDQCQPTLQKLPFILSCGLMASPFSPFSRCRSFVNPADLIRDCKYDACRCDDPMQCVCAAFAAYSKQCSDNGKVLAWRFKGTYLYGPLIQCEKKCDNVGEIFTECGSSCAQTCRDLSRDIQCNEQCVPGCQCPSGQVINEEGRCIPTAQCPCYFEGDIIQPGENVDVGKCKTCSCNNGAMTCVDDRDCANKGPCDSFPCKNDGICSSEGVSFYCKCTGNYQGETCGELKPTPCDSSPCKNGGVCSNTAESFSCDCKEGHEGETCEETTAKPCDSSPCMNGGTCEEKGDTFDCECANDFQGETCGVLKEKPCDLAPCKNGGTCTDQGKSFSCKCADGFEGPTCEEPTSKPCDSSPCMNQGTCSNDGDSFSCGCTDDFEGKTCEEAKCKDTKLDILFVVDGSRSVRKANFAKVKEFIERLNKKFEVGPDKTRIALMQFGRPSNTRIEFNLGDKNTVEEVNKCVSEMKYLYSATATGDALKKAREQVFNGEGGDRPDAPNVLILFTDGQATDVGGKEMQVQEAQNLKNEGVKVITVGMGLEKTLAKFRSKLEEMASKASDSDKPLEFEADFQQLDTIANTLVKETCNHVGHRA